jgi:NAD(P)-dependent dehydrogenase (short-subunit alcohol dehydrogenase family)
MLDGTVSVITGAADGIGRGVAERFAGEGSRVCLLDIHQEKLEKTAEEIAGRGETRPTSFCVDITRKEQLQETVAAIENSHGRIDILVNCAGILEHESIVEMQEERWDRIIGTNLKGMFLCTQAVARRMISRKCGNIINISSDSAFLPVEGECAYSASKAAILAFTRVAALELGPYNIRCNAICPGAVDTPLLRRAMETQKWSMGELEAGSPLQKIGTTAEIADIALFLASPLSRHITGEYIMATAGSPMRA